MHEKIGAEEFDSPKLKVTTARRSTLAWLGRRGFSVPADRARPLEASGGGGVRGVSTQEVARCSLLELERLVQPWINGDDPFSHFRGAMEPA